MQTTIILFLLTILIIWIGYLIFLFSKKQDNLEFSEKIKTLEQEKNKLFEEKIRVESDLNKNKEELWSIKEELKQVTTDRDKLSWNNKAMFVEKTNLSNEKSNLEKEISELKNKIHKFEAEEQRKNKEFDEKIQKLDESKKALDDEKSRIRREDEEEQKRLSDEKSRIWNDHENLALAKLRESCQKQTIWFNFYDNSNLPQEFTKLKPDFLVNFLWQYIVFDAKKSRSVKTYIPEQVKLTAKKYKDISEIYPTIFFVVPQDEIEELKNLSHFEEWFSFYIISIDAIEPILANFKKITEYDKIEEFDPQDRETIINLIANYDRHISLQNATNICFAKDSIALMSWKEQLNEKIQEDINIKKSSMRSKKLNEWDIKKIAQNLSEQEKEIWKLISPKVAIDNDEIIEISNIIKD